MLFRLFAVSPKDSFRLVSHDKTNNISMFVGFYKKITFFQGIFPLVYFSTLATVLSLYFSDSTPLNIFKSLFPVPFCVHLTQTTPCLRGTLRYKLVSVIELPVWPELLKVLTLTHLRWTASSYSLAFILQFSLWVCSSHFRKIDREMMHTLLPGLQTYRKSIIS